MSSIAAHKNFLLGNNKTVSFCRSLYNSRPYEVIMYDSVIKHGYLYSHTMQIYENTIAGKE